MEKLLFLLPLAAFWIICFLNEKFKPLNMDSSVWWDFPLIVTEFCLVISLIIWACAVNF
jgi:hypothetical protein